MSLVIGIGVGLSNSTPVKIESVNYPQEPEVQVKDAIISENSSGSLLTENKEEYIKTECINTDNDGSESVKIKSDKSYWNF